MNALQQYAEGLYYISDKNQNQQNTYDKFNKTMSIIGNDLSSQTQIIVGYTGFTFQKIAEFSAQITAVSDPTDFAQKIEPSLYSKCSEVMSSIASAAP